MSEVVNNIKNKIFELSDAMVFVGKHIKTSYDKDLEKRLELLQDIEKKAESLIRKELREITDYSLQYEDFDEEISRNTQECWRVEGVLNRSAFVDKKGKFYFRIVLVTPERQYDETVDRHILVMDYYPVPDEIYYNLEGIGRFKIEKASLSMKKVKKI